MSEILDSFIKKLTVINYVRSRRTRPFLVLHMRIIIMANIYQAFSMYLEFLLNRLPELLYNHHNHKVNTIITFILLNRKLKP